jgi:hypothetical protein
MEMMGPLTLPKDDDFSKMLLESMNAINKLRAGEILAEKGDIQEGGEDGNRTDSL